MNNFLRMEPSQTLDDERELTLVSRRKRVYQRMSGSETPITPHLLNDRGETVILNREEGGRHQLNRTASFIWDCCERHGDNFITNRLMDAYEIDSVTARRDVEKVLSQLQRSNSFELGGRDNARF
jgi:hypothetical protein